MVTLTRNLEERFHVDVFVAGGGPAGIAAAVAARKQGKTVFLCEASGCFGGSSTQGLVPEMMPFDDGINFMAGGVGTIIFERLFGDTSIAKGRKDYKVKVEDMKHLYDDLMVESGADFLLFSRVVDIITDGKGHATHAVVSSRKGLYSVSADMFIDCTGDGSIAVAAGAKEQHSIDEIGKAAGATLCSLWGGVEFGKQQAPDVKFFEEAYAKGMFSQYDDIFCGVKPTHPEIGVGATNLGHVYYLDDRDEKSLTDGIMFARKSVLEYLNYYRTYFNGFENATMIETSNLLGIRESRRIVGDYILDLEDFKACRVFEDEIGRYSFPVDIHPETPDKEGGEEFLRNVWIRHKNPGESYGIPYRTLTPAGLDNVFIAGRNISADRSVHGSVRVIPGCYITGQAAGVAAAVCSEQKKDIHEADIKEIQKRLIAMGAYLPNA